MNHAYNGNLFNVLGDATAFQSKSLKDLLIDAIRYGDQPETKAQLNNIIDASVSAGLDSIIKERALNKELFSTLNLEDVRNRMEKARQRKLQPGFISAFFLPAFNRRSWARWGAPWSWPIGTSSPSWVSTSRCGRFDCLYEKI